MTSSLALVSKFKCSPDNKPATCQQASNTAKAQSPSSCVRCHAARMRYTAHKATNKWSETCSMHDVWIPHHRMAESSHQKWWGRGRWQQCAGWAQLQTPNAPPLSWYLSAGQTGLHAPCKTFASFCLLASRQTACSLYKSCSSRTQCNAAADHLHVHQVCNQDTWLLGRAMPTIEHGHTLRPRHMWQHCALAVRILQMTESRRDMHTLWTATAVLHGLVMWMMM